MSNKKYKTLRERTIHKKYALMQFNNPQRNKMRVTLTIAVKVMTHEMLLCMCSVSL